MQASRRQTGFVALFLVLSVFSGLVAQRSPRILGYVRLPPGESTYPDMMNVSLQTVDGNLVTRLTLLGKTSFVFDRLRRGEYLVVIESPGYESGSARVDLVGPYSALEQTVMVQLGRRLEDPPDSPRKDGKETVALSDLKVPPKAQQELDRAAKASADGKSERAIEHLNKAIEIAPGLYQAYNNLAVEYMKLGRLADAAAALEEAVRLKPDETAALRNLARLHISMERWERAEELLVAALELESESAETLNALGEVHIAFGRFEPALDHFLRASDLKPDLRSYIGIGQCYSLLGRLEESLAEFEQFQRLFPKDPRRESVQVIIAQLKQDLGRE